MTQGWLLHHVTGPPTDIEAEEAAGYGPRSKRGLPSNVVALIASRCG